MPNNTLSGVLEDFVAFLVADPQNDSLWNLPAKSLQEAQQLVPYKIPASKGRIHTYLAWQTKPGTPLGQAIALKYFDATKPEAKQLIDWLRRLFV
ncbi:MAG: hypothetical protein HXX20_18115 [Chloroflexi bacterium]|nr:hypothetical protein [Chloroflexota bacterium]